jgi:hypothetical protein
LAEAERHDNRPTLEAWCRDNGVEWHAVLTECAKRGWKMAVSDDDDPVYMVSTDKGLTWIPACSRVQALEGAFEAAGVPTPWGPGKSRPWTCSKCSGVFYLDGTVGQKCPYCNGYEESDPDPAAEWQPPEMEAECRKQIVESPIFRSLKVVMAGDDLRTDPYVQVAVQYRPGRPQEPLPSGIIPLTTVEGHAFRGGDTMLGLHQDACRWVHAREEATDAD